MANHNSYQQEGWHHAEDAGRTGASFHSASRGMERFNKEQAAIIMERAAWAAAKYTDNHWGIKVFILGDEDVHAMVAGGTVRTVLTTPNGRKPRANKFATHPDAVVKGRRF